MSLGPPITREMLAAGIEAMHAARRDCLEESYVVCEIYLAMYGVAINLMCEAPEPLQ